MSGFDAWLQSQINRPDHVGNVAFEAERDSDWPREADGPGAMKRYLLEERGIYRQKIFNAVDAAWAAFDKEEVEDWRSEGGWLHELMDDSLPWTRKGSEGEADEPSIPGDTGVGAAAGCPRIPQKGGWS